LEFRRVLFRSPVRMRSRINCITASTLRPVNGSDASDSSESNSVFFVVAISLFGRRSTVLCEADILLFCLPSFPSDPTLAHGFRTCSALGRRRGHRQIGGRFLG